MNIIAIVENYHISNSITSLPMMELPSNPLIRFFAIKSIIFGNFQKYFNKKLINSGADLIIVFDSEAYSKQVLNYLKECNKNSRLIFWYWNMCDYSFNYKSVPDGYEIWSYCKSDCEKYNFKHNTTFFSETAILSLKANSESVEIPRYDFVFIGKNKKRKKMLLSFEKRIKPKNFSFYKILVRDRNFYLPGKNRRPPMSYAEYVATESIGKCIVDCCINQDAGFSLRPLEALVLKKKLITNCKELLSSSLCKYGNVFSMNDDLNTIESELKKEYSDVPREIIDYYLADNWIKRFYEK